MHQYPITELTDHTQTLGRTWTFTRGKLNGTVAPVMWIYWQDGPLGQPSQGEAAFNGATVEVVIRAAIDRLTVLDGKMPCAENKEAIVALNAALGALDRRTADRYRRGVMGTQKV